MTLHWVSMSYAVNEYKVTFRFKSRTEESVKYFQADRDLDILGLFKQAMEIDGYNINNIVNTHIYQFNRFSKEWESCDVLYSLDTNENSHTI